MKKMFCLVLALLMVFPMAACRSDAEPPAATETTAAETSATETAEPATEATEPIDEGFVFDVEASLAENAKTVTYGTPREYEAALHKLGFVEYRGDFIRPTLTSGVACMPIRLTYNDEAFRMDFDHLDLVNMEEWDNLTAELKTVEGWSLYGLKNATSLGNLSAYKISNYENADYSDYAEFSPDIASEYVQKADWWLYNLENGTHTCMITIWEYYYPNTGNLYNIVRDHGDPTLLANVPQILSRTEEDLEYEGNGFVEQVDHGFDVAVGDDIRQAQIYFVSKDKQEFDSQLREHFASFGIEETLEDMLSKGIYTEPLSLPFYYRAGMTLREWSQSDYAAAANNLLTTVSLDGKMLVADHAHSDAIETMCCLVDIDKPIEEIVISEEGQYDYLIAPYMLNMNNLTVVEFGSMAEAEEYMATHPNGGN